MNGYILDLRCYDDNWDNYDNAYFAYDGKPPSTEYVLRVCCLINKLSELS